MTEFEEDLKNKINSEKVPMYFTQSGCSMTRTTYIETSWIFDNYKNWRSDEHVQKLVELGGNYVLANENLMKENKRLAQEIVDLKSELDQRDVISVPSFVAEWYEKNEDNLELSIYNLCVDLDKKSSSEISESEFYLWFDDSSNKGIEILISMKDGYKIKEEQKFYLKNKLTDMYLYKKPLGGYGEEPTDSIKNLTDDFKFTQKEINRMDVQSYDKKDEYKEE